MSKKMGRPTIFEGKDLKHRITKGFMTKIGNAEFKKARKRLAKLAKWKISAVSDGDTIEFLSRGEEATVAYLALGKVGLTSADRVE